MTERIYEAIKKASSLLSSKDLDENAAQLLMEFVTNKSGASLLADMRDYLTKTQQTAFWKHTEELLTGKPIQHIIGYEMFYGRQFEVNGNVLIPRPETEELVENALKISMKLFETKDIHMADIGTGSGAIAISFKKEWPEATVAATDISEEALKVAERNAKKNEADITFYQGNLTEPIKQQKWDVVLSNPPYIAPEESAAMSKTVVDFEPKHALFAEEDGLYFYKKLAKELPRIMKTPSLIGLEIGYQQGTAVRDLFQKAFPEAQVEIIQDINGKDRMIFCEIHE